jgi:uncharacterized membrane protein
MISLPTWLSLALLGVFFWSIVNLLDKIIIERLVKQPITIAILDTIISASPALVILCVTPQPWLWSLLSLPVLFAGILFSVFLLTYFVALKQVDVFNVVLLFQLIPIFAIIIGVTIFDETVTYTNLIGVILILLGTLLINKSDRPDRKLSSAELQPTTPSKPRGAVSYKPLILLTVGLLFLVASSTLQKFSVSFLSTLSVFALLRIGALIMIPLWLLSSNTRHDFIITIRLLRPKTISIIISMSVFNVFAEFLVIAAYASGPYSLVAVVPSVQPLFVLLLTLLINTLAPYTIPDVNTGGKIWIRLSAACGVIFGVYLIDY